MFLKNKMPYKAVIFDFDLTLADATKGIYQCMNHALTHFGYPTKEDQIIKKTIGYSIPDSFKILTGNENQELAKQFMDVFVAKADKIMNMNTFVYPQVYSVLPEIQKLGYKTAIVSTKYRYRIEGILERENLQKYIDYIVGGEDVTNHKPNPEGLITSIKKMQLTPNDILYVGDSIVDAKAAENTKVDFCAVLTGTTARDEFILQKVDFIIDNLDGLIQILRNDSQIN